MPTYEYTCRACGEDLEVVQSFSDEPLRVCPKCGGELRKVFGNVGIVFKGSGFYKTDSRDSAKSAKPKSATTEVSSPTPEAAPASAEKSNGASGTESKAPATATTSPPAAS